MSKHELDGTSKPKRLITNRTKEDKHIKNDKHKLSDKELEQMKKWQNEFIKKKGVTEC